MEKPLIELEDKLLEIFEPSTIAELTPPASINKTLIPYKTIIIFLPLMI